MQQTSTRRYVTSTVGLSVGTRFSPDGLRLYPLAGEEGFEYYAMLVGHCGSYPSNGTRGRSGAREGMAGIERLLCRC